MSNKPRGIDPSRGETAAVLGAVLGVDGNDLRARDSGSTRVDDGDGAMEEAGELELADEDQLILCVTPYLPLTSTDYS